MNIACNKHRANILSENHAVHRYGWLLRLKIPIDCDHSRNESTYTKYCRSVDFKQNELSSKCLL